MLQPAASGSCAGVEALSSSTQPLSPLLLALALLPLPSSLLLAWRLSCAACRCTSDSVAT